MLLNYTAGLIIYIQYVADMVDLVDNMIENLTNSRLKLSKGSWVRVNQESQVYIKRFK